jgi:hypothetical protein
MRRTDVVVGQAYYHAPDADWKSRKETTMPWGRAVIVDVGHWMYPDRTGPDDTGPQEPVLCGHGHGVLADLYPFGGQQWERKVVLIGALRGPYKEIRAQVEAVVQRRERLEQRDWQDLQVLVGRANRLGLKSVELSTCGDGCTGDVMMGRQDFRALMSEARRSLNGG